jgi:hypothetical protein
LNAEGIPTLENAAFGFTSLQGRKMLFISLQFAPRNPVIDWVKKLADAEKYKDHTPALLTYSYLNAKN